MNVSIINTQMLIWTFPLHSMTVNSCYNQPKQNTQPTQWRSDHDPKTWAALCIAIEAVQLTTLGIFSLIKPLRGNNVHHIAECELRHSEWLDNLPEGTQEATGDTAGNWTLMSKSLAPSPNTRPFSTPNLCSKACAVQQERAESRGTKMFKATL